MYDLNILHDRGPRCRKQTFATTTVVVDENWACEAQALVDGEAGGNTGPLLVCSVSLEGIAFLNLH